jgi:hypothetical protein
MKCRICFSFAKRMRTLFAGFGLTLLAVTAVAVDLSVDIDTPEHQIDMPVTSALKRYDFTQKTPWGDVQTHSIQGDATLGQIRYLYDFNVSKPTPAVLNPGKLTQVVRYFLRSHKCSAVEIKQAPLLDAQGNAWPQIVWGGSCAGGDSYQNVQFIARGRVYQLGVSYQWAIATADSTASNPTAPDLAGALRVFAKGCRFL